MIAAGSEAPLFAPDGEAEDPLGPEELLAESPWVQAATTTSAASMVRRGRNTT
jgi:hypothetical protein